MPMRAQWARCFIRHYRNFGTRVTSGTEASNNNIKSYLLNGLSHLHRLVDVMQDMIQDQELSFTQACAADEVLSGREYMTTRSEYLGELRSMLSSKALGLITRQHRLAKSALPTSRNPRPDPLGNCTDDCSVSVEYGIPCYHKIYLKLVSLEVFTKWDVHPRWRLRESSSQDPYRRILDPKIATSLRGRPKNATQPVPARLAVQEDTQPSHTTGRQPAQQTSLGRRRGRPPGSRNRTTLATLTRETTTPASNQDTSLSQRQTRSQVSRLRAGRTTGVRMSGQQLQASIRRNKSQWELLSSSSEDDTRRRTRSSQK
ncbi:mutator-like element [Colletotrichum musicola]|uniref:Mutator-like element n=1 Tax=Colletotrichum musicola TaxID=2175873 RepID=A0A8H6JL08_9PEZI|nr:mutator-like element [Colletotrichum musicola]